MLWRFRFTLAASLLAKRIAFLVTGPSLYAMSVFDRGLNLALDNCITEYTHHDGRWRSRMVLRDIGASEPHEDRARWREGVIAGMFAGHLAPVWRAFTAASGIAPRILWENTAVRVYALYERKMPDVAPATRRDQTIADFDYLLRAPAALFGTAENPLATYHFARSPTGHADGRGACTIRFRKTCCLYYKATTPPEYCSTCPLIKPGRQQRHR